MINSSLDRLRRLLRLLHVPSLLAHMQLSFFPNDLLQ